MTPYTLVDARARAIDAAEGVLFALLSASAEDALRDSTYLSVLSNAMHLRSYLLAWEPWRSDA